MSKERALKREAKEASERRGHQMKRYRRREFWGTPYAECAECGMEVDVTTRPAPNQIDIAGEAVALNCRSTEATAR